MLTGALGSDFQRQLYELSLLTQCTIDMRIQVRELPNKKDSYR